MKIRSMHKKFPVGPISHPSFRRKRRLASADPAARIIHRAVGALPQETKACSAFLAAVLLAACQPVPQGPPNPPDLSYLPETYRKGTLFRMYRAGGTSIPADNWTRRFDFTGVAWNDRRTVTAISRRHVVMASHFTRDPDTPAVFHDRDGRAHSRKVVWIRHLTSLGDIAIGTLDSPLPPEIRHYPLVTEAEATPMTAVLVTDQTRTVSIHRIGFFKDRRVFLGYDPKIDKRHHRNLVYGDSGNPAFVVGRDGGLKLLTTFTTGGPGSGPFFGHPEVRSGVLRALRDE